MRLLMLRYLTKNIKVSKWYYKNRTWSFSMKTITLKTDDIFFEKVNDLAKKLHLTKSELIRRSIVEYELLMEKKTMKEHLCVQARVIKRF